MKNFILSTTLMLVPFSAYCDKYFVSNNYDINKHIQQIENAGFKIKNIKYEKITEIHFDVIITYE